MRAPDPRSGPELQLATSVSSTGAPLGRADGQHPHILRCAASARRQPKRPARLRGSCRLERLRLAWLTASITLPSGTLKPLSLAGSGTTRGISLRAAGDEGQADIIDLGHFGAQLAGQFVTAQHHSTAPRAGLGGERQHDDRHIVDAAHRHLRGGMPTGIRFVGLIFSLMRIAASSGSEPTRNRAVTITPLSAPGYRHARPRPHS
jgi:hypothetical protein